MLSQATVVVIKNHLASFEMKLSLRKVDRKHRLLVVISDFLDLLDIYEGNNAGDGDFLDINGFDIGELGLKISPLHTTTGVHPDRVIRMQDVVDELVVSDDVGSGTVFQ